MRTLHFLKQKYHLEPRGDADESVIAEIFLNGDYSVIEPALRAAKRGVLDVGAHKGFFILYVRALNESVPVFAYEPEEKNFASLKEHLHLNHVEGVTSKNAAVAGEEGSVLLNVSADSHNHSLVVDPGMMKTQKVSAVTLERVLAKMAATGGGCDVVKMDVEGAEFGIFAAAGPLAWEVPVYFLEYHEYGPEMRAADLKKLFEQNGYRVKMLPSKYDKRMGFLWAQK